MLPLFFIPHANVMSHDLLVSHGLDQLIGSSYEHVQTSSGPDGLPGLIVAHSSVPTERLRYMEREQTWSPRYGYASLVGTYKADPPTAAELARDKQIAGGEVQLLDGCHWMVPVLRAWRVGDSLQYEARLPRVLRQCAQTGAWLVDAIVPQYRDLWDSSLRIAEALFAQLTNSDKAELDPRDLFDFAVALLRVNYRVDASLLSHLGILQPELCALITRHALDFDTLIASLKKTLSQSLSDDTNTVSGAVPPTTE